MASGACAVQQARPVGGHAEVRRRRLAALPKLDAKLHELDMRNNDEKDDEAHLLPPLRNGETGRLRDPKIEDKETGHRRVTTKAL